MLKTSAILILAAAVAVAAPADETGERREAPSKTVKDLPPAAKEIADQAKAAFEKGDYKVAEKLYAKAVELAPNNLHVVSNLGVSQFRNLEYGAAEKTFRKAIAIAPEDDFSWCTLGITQYSQNKFEDAMSALVKSLELNPKNATARNYLGITVAQRGWIEHAQKELKTAIELDPKYADAYFNLAVTFTLMRPPNLEEARKAYKKALELGAQADKSMEELLNSGAGGVESEPIGAGTEFKQL